MNPKQILVITCSTDLESVIPRFIRCLQKLGYEYDEQHVFGPCAALASTDAFDKIEQKYPTLLSVDNLAKFDAITIYVQKDWRAQEIIRIANEKLDNIFGTDYKPNIIAKEFVSQLREQVKLAEIKRGSPIPIVGVNFHLEGEDLRIQKEIFDGLFIAEGTTLEEMKEYLG